MKIIEVENDNFAVTDPDLAVCLIHMSKYHCQLSPKEHEERLANSHCPEWS